MGREKRPVHSSSSSYTTRPPPLRRIPPIPLPPIEEPSLPTRLIVDPEVGPFLRVVDWHLALGPRNISRLHPLLDRRLFVSTSAHPNPNPNAASSSSSSTSHTQMQTPTLLVHVYTPGRVLPSLHTSHLTLRLYPHARVRDLFYEIADCLAGPALDVEEGGLSPLSLSGEGSEGAEDETRVRVRNAQRWRVAEGFTEVGTTSLLPRSSSVDGGEGLGVEGAGGVIFADYLNGDWVVSDFTPVNAPDGVVSFSVLFKRA